MAKKVGGVIRGGFAFAAFGWRFPNLIQTGKTGKSLESNSGLGIEEHEMKLVD